MKRAVRSLLVVGFALAGLEVRAQGTFEVVGKVVDADGKPVVGASLHVANIANPAVARDGNTDKRGNFSIDGLLYSQQNRFWSVALEAPGLVPVKANVVARMGDRTLYDQYEKSFDPGDPPLEIRVMGVGEVRIEFTMASEETVQRPIAVDEGVEAVEPAPKAEDPYLAATQRASSGDLEGSVELFGKAVEAVPADPERREFFARVLMKLDRPEEARAQAAKAAELAPDRASAHLTMADVEVSLGNLKKARESLTEARRAAPEDVTVLRRIAWIANETNDRQAAIEANEAIVRLETDDVEAWLSLGDLYNQVKNSSKSEEAYRKVTELDPQNAYKTFFNLGALIENRPDLSESDNRKAMEAFRKAIEVKPDYALAHRHLAYALLRAGDMAGAKKSFRKYLELAPKAPDAAEIRQTVESLP